MQAQCVHCGLSLHKDVKEAHERACRQERARAPPKVAATGAAQRRPVQASRKAPNRMGAPQTFQIPDPPADDPPKNPRSTRPANKRPAAAAPPVPDIPTSTPTAMVQINIPVPPSAPQLPRHAAAAVSTQSVDAGRSSGASMPAPPAGGADPSNSSSSFQEGSYKIEFHPHANRSPIFQRAQDFQNNPAVNVRELNQEPWAPAFKSRIDFEVAEFSLKAGLNEPQVTTLLALIRRIVAEPAEFSLENASDVQDAWEGARFKQPAFECSQMEVDISDVERKTYEFHHRDLWDVGVSLVQDPLLCKHIVWHPMKQYRFEKGKWTRFIDEPYTANLLYDYQTKLPQGAVSLPFILYADKTRLSTFGTQEGYPIIARLANLPSSIRNSTGHGSGQIVGLLPLVKDPNAKKGEPKFVKHKRVVWHAGFLVVMKQAIEKARKGERVLCGDDIWRLLIPLILILIADYEEQCMMALIRGLKGLFPCPVCLIPKDKLNELGLTSLYPLRNAQQHISILQDKSLNKTALEEALKAKSLRAIKNSLWPLCDPHRATSFDKLHAYETGLFGHHLFGEFQRIVKDVPKNAAVKAVNKQIGAVPRWPQLWHTDDVMSHSFSDGSKYDDLSRIIVPATYNILVESTPSGLSLMRAMRVFGLLNAILSFEVQNEERLSLFTSLLPEFMDAIKDYGENEPDKIWLFIKAHSHQHAAVDIWLKGVIKNLTSKPNEKMHRLLKIIYRDRTNFKNVEGQIAAIAHQFLIALYIRFQMETYDELTKAIPPEEKQPLHQYHHVYLGSPDAAITLEKLMRVRGDEPALSDLPKKLTDHMNRILKAMASKGESESEGEGESESESEGESESESSKVTPLPPKLKISPFKYLKVQYVSLETWRVAHDPLRCNPSFYGAARYDFVIYRGAKPGEYHFGQLQFMFVCEHDDMTFPVAIVKPYHPIFLPRSKIEDALGLFRIRARPTHGKEDPYILVHMGSLVRGVVTIKDEGLPLDYIYEEPEVASDAEQEELDAFQEEHYNPDTYMPPQHDDRLVADLVDGDMLLRMRQYFPFLKT